MIITNRSEHNLCCSMPVFFLIFFFLCGLVFFPATSHAGQMIVKPMLDLEMGQTSNYYRAEESGDEDSVTYFAIKPGFKFGWHSPKSLISLTYTLSDNDFEHVSGTEDQDYIGHTLDLQAQTQITPRITIGLENQYDKTRESGRTDLYDDSITKYKYDINQFSPKLFYKFNDKFKLSMKYTNTFVDYSNKTQEDSTQNKGAFDLRYNLNKDMAVSLGYALWVHDYDENLADYLSNEVDVNFFRTYRWLTVELGAGYHERSFDGDSVDDIDMMTWNVTLGGETDSGKTNVELDLSKNYNNFVQGNDYYEATRLSADIDHKFMRKIDLGASVIYQYNDYEYESRDDDIWTLSSRLGYTFNDMFSFSVEPAYEKRNSSESGRDYDNYYVLFGVSWNYDVNLLQ